MYTVYLDTGQSRIGWAFLYEKDKAAFQKCLHTKGIKAM